jgi:hypothetical protein
VKLNFLTRATIQNIQADVVLQVSLGKVQCYGTEINAHDLYTLELWREERMQKQRYAACARAQIEDSKRSLAAR